MAEVVRELVAILRYIAAPVVALIAVWLCDENHDAPSAAARVLPRSADVPLGWVIAALLIAAGLVVYYAHRTLFHPLLGLVLTRIRIHMSGPQPSATDLDFARWQRRGAVLGLPQRSVQSVLDEANAASHFFYCSGWCAIGASWVIGTLAPGQLQLGQLFYIVVPTLFLLAVVYDWRMGSFDIEAYRRFDDPAADLWIPHSRGSMSKANRRF